MLAFPASRHYSGHFHARRCPLVSGSKRPAVRDDGPRAGYGSGLPALRYSEDSLSPAYNVTAAQSKELQRCLLWQKGCVFMLARSPRIQCITAIPAFFTFSSAMSGLGDNEQWLWATRYSWGRKLAVG